MQNNFHKNYQKQSMDLPIIHQLIEIYKVWQEYLPHFPKTSRYTLGAKIDNLFSKLIELIFLACYQKGKQKISLINKSSSKLDLLKFFLRVAWEIRALDNKKYIVLSQKLNEIGKMIGGWLNHLKKKLPPSAGEQR